MRETASLRANQIEFYVFIQKTHRPRETFCISIDSVHSSGISCLANHHYYYYLSCNYSGVIHTSI